MFVVISVLITLQGLYIEFYIEPYTKNDLWPPAIVHFVYAWCPNLYCGSKNVFLGIFEDLVQHEATHVTEGVVHRGYLL